MLQITQNLISMELKQNIKSILASSNILNSTKNQIRHPQDLYQANYNDPEEIKQFAKRNEQRLENMYNRMCPSGTTDVRDFKWVLPFPEQLINQLQDIQINVKWPQTIKWLGKMYIRVASASFQLLIEQYLSYDEAKAHLCQNILINIINLLEKKNINKQKMGVFGQFVNQITNQILQYLLTKYPQTKLTNANKALSEIVKPINNMASIDNDMLLSSSIRFNIKKTANYTQQIMRMINHVLMLPSRQIQQFKQTNEEYFTQFFQNLFQTIYVPMHIDKDKLSAEEYKKACQQYSQKQKKRSSYTIFRKIDKHFPLFTQQQIASERFSIKGPNMARVLTKWLEMLSDILQNPEKNILEKNTRFKGKDGSAKKISMNLKKILARIIAKNRHIWKSQIDQLLRHSNIMQESIVHKFYDLSFLDFLDQEDIKLGDFACKLQSISNQYLLQALNCSIHHINNCVEQTIFTINDNAASFNIDQPSKQKMKERLNIELIQFKISDLLRCKCVSSEKNIIFLYNKLLEACQKQQTKMQITRIKNRLAIGTRDILINVLLNKQILCEIQLSIQSEVNKKQVYYDKFNHILYEIKRAKFGPINQSATIWSNYDQRSLSFKSQLKKYARNKINQHDRCIMHKCPKHKMKNQFLPLICSSCELLVNKYVSIFKNQACQGCDFRICGRCRNLTMTFQNRLQYIFGKGILEFSPYISEFDHDRFQVQGQEKFPKFGIMVKKQSAKKSIHFFTKIKELQTDMMKEWQEQKDAQQRYKQKSLGFDHQQNFIKEPKKENEFILSFVESKFNQEFNLLQPLDEQLNILYSITGNFSKAITKILNQNFIFYFHEKEDKQKQLSIINYSQAIDKKVSKFFIKDYHKKNKEIDKVLNQYANNLSVFVLDFVEQTSIFLPIYSFAEVKEKKEKAQAKIQLKKIIRQQSTALTVSSSFLMKEIIETQNQKIFNKIRQISIYNESETKPIQSEDFKAITKLPNLIDCQIYMVSLSQTDMKMFAGLTKLENLTIVASDIDNDQIENFCNSKNLKRLTLFQNQLQDLTFTNQFQKLEELDLQHNEVYQIVPLNLPNLRVLKLNENALREIKNLERLSKLEKLILSTNSIAYIHNLDSLISLKYLDLSSNYIIRIENISHLQLLQQFNISDNDIQQIDFEITMLANLKTFILKKHNFSTVPSVLNMQQILRVFRVFKQQQVKLIFDMKLRFLTQEKNQKVYEIKKAVQLFNIQYNLKDKRIPKKMRPIQYQQEQEGNEEDIQRQQNEELDNNNSQTQNKNLKIQFQQQLNDQQK